MNSRVPDKKKTKNEKFLFILAEKKKNFSLREKKQPQMFDMQKNQPTSQCLVDNDFN